MNARIAAKSARRMLRTRKAEATRPPSGNLQAQQIRFNRFRGEYNDERPHEALDQETPGSVYQPSPRELPRASIARLANGGQLRAASETSAPSAPINGAQHDVVPCLDRSGESSRHDDTLQFGLIDDERVAEQAEAASLVQKG